MKKSKNRIEIFVSDETKAHLVAHADKLSIGVATVVKIAIEKFLKESL